MTDWPRPVARPLPGYELPPSHPLAPRSAFQCVTCNGIFYPPATPPLVCPYCIEESDD